jgi:hypothetical protein
MISAAARCSRGRVFEISTVRSAARVSREDRSIHRSVSLMSAA